MKWIREPKAVNEEPSYKAAGRSADYRIIPVAGGWRLHYRPHAHTMWACHMWRPKLRNVRDLAEGLELQPLEVK